MAAVPTTGSSYSSMSMDVGSSTPRIERPHAVPNYLPFARQASSNFDPPSIETATTFQRSDPSIPYFPSSSIRELRFLGNGSYGVVHLVQVPRLGKVVKKTINRLNFGLLDTNLAKERRELVYSMMLNHHPNIVPFYGEVFDQDPMYPIGFLSEYMPGGNLYEYMTSIHDQPLSLHLQNGWCYQIALALAYMHSNKILHRDLNPNNILLGNPITICKIADLGLAKEMESGEKAFENTVGLGTGFYKAPEVLTDPRYSYPVDVYSYGMTVFFIFARQAPFQNDVRMRKVSSFLAQLKLVGSATEAPIRPELGYGVIDSLIENCWQATPTFRPTMDQVLDELDSFTPAGEGHPSQKKYPTTEDL